MKKVKNKWFSFETIREAAEYNLFCFPHAGSGASNYAQWGKFVPESYSFYPVQYPMRENRYKETMPESLKELARKIAEENKTLFLSKPAVFYGHCYGAILAYETALILQEEYGYLLDLFVVGSSHSPRISEDTLSLEQASHAEVASFFVDLGYMDANLINNKMYMDFFMSVLKTDYILLQKYVPEQGRKLCTNIYAVYSSEDSGIEPAKVEEWSAFTEKEVKTKDYPGGHFFLNETNLADFFQEINQLRR